jgi:hypothetical protein
MARKICTICNTRPVGTGAGVDPQHARTMGYCNPCLTEAEWENMHSDYCHEGIADGTYEGDDHTVLDMDNCWVCHPELNAAAVGYTPKTGHTNTRAHSWNSHSSHGHARTPEARAACRKFMAAHNGMDEVTFRVAQREQELEDAYADEEFDLATYVRDNGCMYHRDNPKHCDGKPAFRVSGDVWCATALKAARRGIVIPRETIEKL